MHHSLIDNTLFGWTNSDQMTIRDSTEGILILGQTGSSKTTGSGAMIARSFLLNGYGGLVLSVKGEKKLWQSYCKAYGREKDLVILGPDSGEFFNFLDYESNLRGGAGKGIVHNIADTLKAIIKAGDNSGGQESDKQFWDSSFKNLLVNVLDLILLTQDEIRFDILHRIIQSAPRNQQQLQSKDWKNNSHCFRLMHHAAKHLSKASPSPEVDKRARRLHAIQDFFLGNWLHLSEKTRSIIEQMFASYAARYLSDPLYTVFNTETTITPEDCYKKGKIILIDFPYLTYEGVGRDANILFKYVFQRAMQRRTIIEKSRPCFLFSDEYQTFIHEQDFHFQSIIRDYRVSTVYLTQNLPNFYLNAGQGELGKTRFRALAGNLATKIFHANNDPDTNEYAADLIGKDWHWSENEGQTSGKEQSYSSGASETLAHIVDPSVFTKLKTGGPRHNFLTEAIIHRSGRLFFENTGKYELMGNYLKLTIKQKLF